MSSLIINKIAFSQYTAIDLSKNNIEKLRADYASYKNCDFIQGAFESIVLDKKDYDVVISSLTLKHQYPTFVNTLKNIKKYVKKDGGLFVFDLIENHNVEESKTDLSVVLQK